MRIDQPDPSKENQSGPESAREGRDEPESAKSAKEPEVAAGPEEQVAAQVRYRKTVTIRYQETADVRYQETADVRYQETADVRHQETADVRHQQTADVRHPQSADAALAAWAGVVPQLRAAWEEHKARYPERTQATSRTEADGTWTCGEHRRLDPEQNAEAGKAHADLADEADRHVLPALRRIEAASPERQLAGIEHMVKGEDRLKEKLADAWHGRPGLTTGQVLSMVPDAVRSTLMYSPEH